MYKYDIHVHTSETSPCGKIEAVDVVKLYKEAGYTGVVITDHFYKGFFDRSSGSNWEMKVEDYLKGYKKALTEGKNIGLNVLLGMEIKFNDDPNDYLVYGIDEEFLKNSPELFALNLKQFRDYIADKGMLTFQAHPYRKGQYIIDPGLLDGIEVYNGNPRHNSQNDLAYKYAVVNHLKMISGSDFHQINDLARGGIIVNKYITTMNELLEILKQNKITDLIRTDYIENV